MTPSEQPAELVDLSPISLAFNLHFAMPKPYIFASKTELIEMLRGKATCAAAQQCFSDESANLADVVRTGVSGNTFRAFRNLPVRPSVAFREWATNYTQNTLGCLLSISETSQYSAYVHNTAQLLSQHWRELTDTEMGYGRAAKLFNLVLKRLACLKSLSAEQRQTLIALLHVPLDSYTIVGLQTVAPELSIPKRATMKYVESPLQYVALQNKIATFALAAGVPPIYYDILAWNMGHPRVADAIKR